MATYAEMLRKALWPNGPKSASTGEEAAQPTRDEAMKLRTRVLCRTVMLGSVAGKYIEPVNY